MFLWWSSTEIVQAIWIRQKTWPPVGGAYFPYTATYRKLKKSFCQKLLDLSPYNFAEMFLWWFLYQDCSSHLDSSKNIAARGWGGGGWRGLFSLYIYIENLKNLLVRNHWNDCNIMWQKCSFGDSLPRLFKPFGFVKKHGLQGAGLIFPIYLYRKTWKIFLSETTGLISL